MGNNKIKFKSIFKEDYNPKYTNGAVGGINHNGELLINFYFERPPLVHSEEFELEDENIVSIAKIPVDSDYSLVRVFETGVIMNYNAAVNLKNWIEEQLSTYNEFKDGSNN